MFLLHCFYVLLVTAAAGLADVEKPLGTRALHRPLVLAHRGSSGQLPELSLEAIKLAIEQGADAVEIDLCVTKDLKLILAHEPYLNHTTNVHDHPEFRDRVQTYTFQGTDFTDYFTVDFTLEELKTLKRRQPVQYRDHSHDDLYPMVSFDECIRLVKSYTNIRTVTIYPELKIPAVFNQIFQASGKTMEDLVIETLNEHGYNYKDAPCYIQSFDIESLKRMSNRTELPLMYLIEDFISDADLWEFSSFLNGINAEKQAIVHVDPNTRKIVRTTDFIKRAKLCGLEVYVYTFRNEDQYMAFDYGADPHQEYKHFIDLGVDGIFTDFPQTLRNYLNQRECQRQIFEDWD